MTVRREQHFHDGVYFITFTCYKWLSLFSITEGYNLVYKWFDVLVEHGNHIIGYVIMPNHIHAIIAFRKHTQSINTRVGTGKRFIAYGLVDILKEQNNQPILEALAHGVNKADQKRGQKHEVFEPSFDCKECRDNEFILQKLNYIHANPCRGKWNLADIPINYPHCSAYFYETGNAGYCKQITHYSLLDNIDLSQPKGQFK